MAASTKHGDELFSSNAPTQVPVTGLGASPEAVLASYFGFSAFRSLQREIIAEALAGRSVIAILPTGSGKSVCFQVPALILPGVTLVVSPLISLMKDQVDGLVERGISALAITSHDTAEESRDKLARFQTGQARLVYVAPERLVNEAFLSACARLCQPGAPGISLLAVDEAHCVSQWGHDFRPEYRQIAGFRARIGEPPLMALTATAQPRVQAELAGGLGIKGAKIYKAPIDRPALWIGVEHCNSQIERRQRITRLVSSLESGSAIVYATSRADTESLAEDLHKAMQGRVSAYHAGLSPEARTAVQNRFMAGFLKVVVATNAFGMGIDKPDIRLVIHAGVPDSVEAYFQEIGRAGRDGQPARCLMVLMPGSDVKRREYLLAKNEDPHALERFARMKNWVWLSGECRRAFLSRYFGDPPVSHDHDCCSHCHPWAAASATIIETEMALPAKNQRKKAKDHLKLREAAAEGRKATGAAPPVRLSETRAELLFENLREWRMETAQSAEVPAFVVFGDRDLRLIALAAPRTLDELAACRGVGPHKLEAYGAAILAVVAPFAADEAPEADNLVSNPPPPMAVPTPRATDMADSRLGSGSYQAGPTAQGLLALLSAGRLPEEIARHFACPVDRVWELAIEMVPNAAAEDWKLIARSLIPRPDYRELASLFGQWRAEGRLPVGDKLQNRSFCLAIQGLLTLYGQAERVWPLPMVALALAVWKNHDPQSQGERG